MGLEIRLGTDTAGREVSTNLTEVPHLLVAGTTGSGKSVFLNSLILDLISHHYDEVRLLLIDPKRVELAAYNGLPHVLFASAIWETELAVRALEWLSMQMEQRFTLLASVGARNDDNQRWPQIVCVIDELANLILDEPAVQKPLVRIASMARAVGIHLVMATQRPDATVLTGLLRGNIPARVAFATITAAESRIILDENGAEQLAGKGDMLVRLPGKRTLLHLQGRNVTDHEIEDATTAAGAFA